MSLTPRLQQKTKRDAGKALNKEAFLGGLFTNTEKLEELKNKMLELIPNGSVEEIEQLIKSGVDAKDPALLTEAIIYSRADIVDLLLKNGADAIINSVIEYGMTPLTLLINNVDNNYKEVFRILIDAGADILLADNSGNTPLHYAVMKDNSFIMSAIITLSNNAEELLNTKNAEQLTPMDIAKNSNNKDLIEYLNSFNKTKNTKGEIIDFFDAKIKRLKKKLTPSQYEDLKEEYEDLREENLNQDDRDWQPTNFKERILKLLEEWDIIETMNVEYYDDEDEEENKKK